MTPPPLAARYRFLKRLRGTSAGLIWLASDSVTGRTVVASSIMAARLPGLENTLDIKHPHLAGLLARIDDVGPDQIPDHQGLRAGSAVMIAEYVPGQTLHERLKSGKIPPRTAVRWFLHIANALRAAHERGGFHGALSPRSILVARADGGRVPLVTNLVAPANGAYCSPDRVNGGGPSAVDDVWAIHSTLFAALTASAPFQSDTRDGLARSILSGMTTPLSRFGVTDKGLQRILERGLVPDTQWRVRDITELEQQLVVWLRDNPEAPDSATAPPPAEVFSVPPPSVGDEEVAAAVQDPGFAPPPIRFADGDDEDRTKKMDPEERLRALDSKRAVGPPMIPFAPLEEEEEDLATSVMDGPLLEAMREQSLEFAGATEPPVPQPVVPQPVVPLGEVEISRPRTDSDASLVTSPYQQGGPQPQESESAPGPGFSMASLTAGFDEPATAPDSGPSFEPGPAEPSPIVGVVPPSAPLFPEAPSPAIAVAPPVPATPPAHEPAPAKSRSGLWIVVAALVVLAATGGSFVFFAKYAHKLRGTPPPPTTPPSRAPSASTAPKTTAPPSTGSPSPSATKSAPAPSTGASGAYPTPANLHECIENLFPPSTFRKKIPFDYVCTEPDPRKIAADFHSKLVDSSRGHVTSGMKMWSTLGWYELAVVAVMRDRCCPGAGPLVLPETTEPCKPLTDVLREEVLHGSTDWTGIHGRTRAFEKGVRCLYLNRQQRPFRYREAPRNYHRNTFMMFLRRAPDDGGKPVKK